MCHKKIIAITTGFTLLLTGCNSMGARDYNPTKEKQKQVADKQAEKERKDLEHSLKDSSGEDVKWRQIDGNWLVSYDDDWNLIENSVDNPMKNKGVVSPNDAAASFIISSSQGGGKAMVNTGSNELTSEPGEWPKVYTDISKDFGEKSFRDTTSYDPEFLSKAEIDFDKLQKQVIKNSKGQVIANMPFVNQKYSSYLAFKSDKTPTSESGSFLFDMTTGYVAVPTNVDVITDKGTATYKGHTIGNETRDGSIFNLADIELNANFDNMTIAGKVTNRNDALLEVRARFNSTVDDNESEEFTDDINDKWTTQISAEKMQARKDYLKTVDITLKETAIKTDNGVVSFRSEKVDNYRKGLEYTDFNGVKVQLGEYGGIFAGPKAEEVVGYVSADNGNSETPRVSFGAKEVK